MTGLPPVVLICGMLPLGVTVGMFNLIFALMQASTATSLTIALGLGAGLAIVRVFRRQEAVAV